MPIRYSSHELIQIITKDGWYLERIKGSHHIFKHLQKHGTVVVPHPEKDVNPGTVTSILKDAELWEKYLKGRS